MGNSRTLFLQFDSEVWTGEELDNLMEIIGEQIPDDADAIAVSDDIEYMDEEMVERFANNLLDVLQGDDA